MCFVFNPDETFAVLEQSQSTFIVFKAWFEEMNDFKKDFEIRRVLLGLVSLFKAKEMPALVQQKVSAIMH